MYVLSIIKSLLYMLSRCWAIQLKFELFSRFDFDYWLLQPAVECNAILPF